MSKLNTNKKPFCKIEWTDCELDYSHTICEFERLADEIEAVEVDFTEIDEEIYKDTKPSFTVSVVFLTDEEFTAEIQTYE